MSAYGLYPVCSSKCLCPKCKLNGHKCKPCMDCIGEIDTVPEDDYTNGYTDKCILFRE